MAMEGMVEKDFPSDLDKGGREFTEIIERRESAAKVVNRKAHTADLTSFMNRTRSSRFSTASRSGFSKIQD